MTTNIINVDDETIAAMYAALKVVGTGLAARYALEQYDPKALKQVEAALALAEYKAPVEVEVFEDMMEEFSIVADFRGHLGDMGNFDFAEEVRNNFDAAEVVVDPELSAFHAYATSAEDAKALGDFITDFFSPAPVRFI